MLFSIVSLWILRPEILHFINRKFLRLLASFYDTFQTWKTPPTFFGRCIQKLKFSCRQRSSKSHLQVTCTKNKHYQNFYQMSLFHKVELSCRSRVQMKTGLRCLRMLPERAHCCPACLGRASQSSSGLHLVYTSDTTIPPIKLFNKWTMLNAFIQQPQQNCWFSLLPCRK